VHGVGFPALSPETERFTKIHERYAKDICFQLKVPSSRRIILASQHSTLEEEP
jgi:hypothetical protein